jgi:transcriptional regulator with GAF, ATPase, and Fis domain/tetratricopeptide (TPR) repeat protein
MNKPSRSAPGDSRARKAKPSDNKPARTGRLSVLTDEQLDEIFASTGEELRNGRSSRAEEIIVNALDNNILSADAFANLKRLLSFTLETVGRYKESLEAVQPFEDEENLGQLSPETQVRVITQLAVAYNNLTDQPKAVTLLKETLGKAKESNLEHLSGNIDSALARVYRKLNECSIARDYAEKSLNYFRNNGDWIGMAEAYRELALSYHQEGNSERSLGYFELGIKMIGEHSAPFMLGKLYTDMSGAYWFLRRPHDGIACLEKSIEFFDQTEHLLNSVIAYNNLGINLMLIGEWPKAQEVIERALSLATKQNHVHIAGILDSLGELKILRGELEDAEELLERAVAFARERKRDWYAVQSMRNLSRCYLAQERFAEAAAMARQTIEQCGRIGDKHYAIMAGLVLAESSLRMGHIAECESALQAVEEADPSSDFYVLGNIQRIRGLTALENEDRELAVHHFSRSLTIFESAEDIFHTALAHYLTGANLRAAQSARALRHLQAADEIFRRLGVGKYVAKTAEEISRIKKLDPAGREASGVQRRNSVVSQLLMVRLAEATASRELLFREFVAVLQQESKASKILIAEPDEARNLTAFITHGYTPQESAELVRRFDEELKDHSEKGSPRTKNLAVFPLRASSAPVAYLLIQPESGAVLNDGSPLQPLVRVVELGMDVIALRERDKSQPIEPEASLFTSNSVMPGFIHSSPAMTSLVEEVYKIRSSDVTVLVTGESGTGKELVSRAIHALSNRKDKIFVPFNCTAVPKELAEGHLFGYRKGSFTGAVTDSPGMIRAADGGTLFLDEIGDLPLDVQPKLLRFLQEGEVQPIGEKKPIKVDVRVIAATNMPLENKVAEGSFREDLYYRLNVIRLRVPPLRERRSEIPPIINYYVNHYSSRFGKREITFAPQTVDLLMVCNWEGNVRQLCNEIQRIIARAVDGELITPDSLSPELKRSARPLTIFGAAETGKTIATYNSPFTQLSMNARTGTLEDAVSELETQMIKTSLARNNWNISRVAGELGLTRRGLYLKLSRYGIEKAVS